MATNPLSGRQIRELGNHLMEEMELEVSLEIRAPLTQDKVGLKEQQHIFILFIYSPIHLTEPGPSCGLWDPASSLQIFTGAC